MTRNELKPGLEVKTIKSFQDLLSGSVGIITEWNEDYVFILFDKIGIRRFHNDNIKYLEIVPIIKDLKQEAMNNLFEILEYLKSNGCSLPSVDVFADYSCGVLIRPPSALTNTMKDWLVKKISCNLTPSLSNSNEVRFSGYLVTCSDLNETQRQEEPKQYNLEMRKITLE